MPTLFLLFIAALAAFAVSTLVGGGAGILLMPILVLALPVAAVPAALSIGTATSSLARIAVFRRSIRWRAVVLFVPAALPFAALGAWLLTCVQPVYVELGLGACLVFNLVFLWRKRGAAPAGRPPRAIAWCAYGAAGGLLSSFTGAIGLAFNGFYLRSGLDKEEILATRAANELLLHLVKLGFYACFGLLTQEVVIVGGVIAAAAVLAPFCARPALGMLDMTTFRRLGQAAAGLAGVVMVASAGGALASQHDIRFGGQLGISGFKASVHWHERAASLHWTRGHSPELEHTIALADLPISARALVEHVGRDADRVVCERVLQLGGTSYEVVVVRDGARTKFKV